MSFSQAKLQNYGGRLLIAHQKSAHQKRLQQIYQKNTNHYSSDSKILQRNMLPKKSQLHLNKEHHKNIQHLFQFITRKKNLSDRLKDPHDFFAYPVYFLREAKQKNNKLKIKKQHKKKQKSSHYTQNNYSQQSQFTRRYGIDVPTTNKYLPNLEQFTEEQIQNYTQSITKLIFQFNLKSKQRVQFLKKCILLTAKPHYPNQFPQIVQQIFQQILLSLNLKDK